MKKKYIILAISFVLIFLFFYYKNLKLGNTIINLSEEKIIENILSNNFKYEAQLKINVYSNKNQNEYKIKIMENGEESFLEANGKSSISGLRIEKKNGDLIIKNTNLKLEKIYEDYKEVTDNSLFLSSFLKDYNEAEKIEKLKQDNEVVIKITIKNYSKYIKYKELYLDEKTGIPTKLLIKDSSNNTKICIEYTSIEIL